jgi:hypothetical protein
MVLFALEDVEGIRGVSKAVNLIEGSWAENSLTDVAGVDRALLRALRRDPRDQVGQPLRGVALQALQQITYEPIGAMVRDEIP